MDGLNTHITKPRWPSWKIKNCQQFDWPPQNLVTVWLSSPYRPIKIGTFENTRWWMLTVTILNIKKSRYYGNGMTDCHKIWHGDAYWPSPTYWLLFCRLSKSYCISQQFLLTTTERNLKKIFRPTLILFWEIKVKGKGFPILHRALGPELILVYRQSARRWL